MQQADFKFEAIVHDDASTDGTTEIIKEYARLYPEIIKPIIEIENQYSKHDGSISRIMYAHIKGKYVAYCEGDDYWTDPYKLQKQVDFLDAHPDFSMCFHAAEIVSTTSHKLDIYVDKVEDREYFTNDIFPRWQVPTASVLLNQELVDLTKPLKHAKWFHYGDIVIFLRCSHAGRIWGMSDKMSVYRRHDLGVSNIRNVPNSRELYHKHIRAMALNFPKISNNYFAQFFYSEIFHEPSVWKRIVYSFSVLKYSPIMFMKKSITIVKHLFS